jgi:hypothetical protein
VRNALLRSALLTTCLRLLDNILSTNIENIVMFKGKLLFFALRLQSLSKKDKQRFFTPDACPDSVELVLEDWLPD